MGLADITVAAAQARRHRPDPITAATAAIANATAAGIASGAASAPAVAAASSPSVATTNTQTDPRRTSALTATPTTPSAALTRLQQIISGVDPGSTALEALANAKDKLKGPSPEKRVRPDMIGVDVPAFVPPEYRKYVAKFGTKYVDPVAGGTGLTGPEYLAALLQFESGYDRNAVSSAGARDLGQFMPGTAATFESEYGVDPIGGSAKDAIKGSAMHLSGNFGHAPLYAGYNPYYGSDPIAHTDVGEEVKVKIPAQGGLSAAPVDQGPSLAKLQRYIQPNESPQEVASELGVPVDRAKIEYTKLSPDLQRALIAVAKQSGDPVSLSEGFRTRARQEALASGTGGATGPAAAPGTSQHEFGQAVDVDLTPEQRAIAEEVGLVNTVPGEPWHFEIPTDEGYAPAGAPGGSSPAAPSYGPTGTTLAAAGSALGTGATVPAAQGQTTLRKDRPYVDISPIENPLSARASLPAGYLGAGPQDASLSALEALVTGTAPTDDSQLASILSALIPKRRT